MKIFNLHHVLIGRNHINQRNCSNGTIILLQKKLLLIVLFLLFSASFNIIMSKNQVIHSDTWYRHNDIVELNSVQPLFSMSVNGKCVINRSNKNSLVRIILITSDGDEKLIAEYNYFNSKTDTIDIDNENLEAYFELPVNAAKLKIITIDASFFLESLNIDNQQALSKGDITKISKQKKTEKIKNINNYLENNGMLWKAGETPFSDLTYSQLKQQLYGGNDSVFLHGYEYYKGGIFSSLNILTSTDSRSTSSSHPKTFTWTRRHGKNWNTPVKNQTYPAQPDSIGNGGCWAFASVALAESYANVYYNKPINLDLSEQDVVSCSSGGSVSHGGFSFLATNYIVNEGIVSESCFPFTNTDAPCSEKCSESPVFSGPNMEEIIRLTEDSIKSLLINKGPIVVTLNNHWYSHCILLVGYGTVAAGDNLNYMIDNQSSILVSVPAGSPFIGKTYWIYKNSYGINHGESGYDCIILDTLHFMSTYIYLFDAPNVSGYSVNDVACEDLDNDGYYNWGIGPKPSYCPSCPDLPDGNDYNPNIGGMDRMGNSIYLADTTQAPYIDGSDAIGCNGKFSIINLPEDANVTWSISTLLDNRRLVNIIGPSTEAMVKVARITSPNFGELSQDGIFVTLIADFTTNSTPFRLTKRIQVFGDISPQFNTGNLTVMSVGQSKTITELNCTNIPAQYIKWDLYVPGVGRYTQFGHSVTVNPTMAGTMSVSVTNLLACNASHSSFSHSFIVINPHFSIVTNPVNEILSLELFECSDRNQELTLDISDSMGNLMHKEKITSDYISVNTSMFLTGVYTIRLLCDGQCIQTDKFIKK